MARIPLVSADNLTPEQRLVYERIVAGPRKAVVGPLRAVLHNPELAEHWQQLGALLRYRTSLPQRLKEIVILVTARRWNAQVEWQIHEGEARTAGVPEELISAIRDARSPRSSAPDDDLVYAFTRDLQQTGQVAKAIYDRALHRFGTAGVVELTAVVGYYTMVAMMLNTHEMTLPGPSAAPALPAVAEGLTALAATEPHA